MRIFFGAFIGTSLLMSIAGIFAMGLVWVLLTALHATNTIIIGSETVTALALLIAAGFVFKMTLGVERQLLETGDLK